MLCSRFGLWRVRALAVLMTLFLAGCPTAPDYPTAAKQTDDGEDEPEPLLQPFDPPPLAELDAQVEWEDQRVVDAMEILREMKSAEPKLATPEEALGLKNDSDDANAKIVSALGAPYESEDEVDYSAEYKRHLPADIKSTNPVMQSSTYEGWVLGLTTLGLFSFDWKMDPYAAKEVVTSWQTSTDKLYDKVVIRDDLVWSDGQPITAHDVEFSFQLIMNPKVPIPAVRTGMESVRWVEAYDDRTVVFFHTESLATNVWNLNFPVIPKHIYEKSVDEDPTLGESDYHLKYEENPVCGGQFKMVKRVKGQEIVLERRDDWYMHDGQQVRPKPHFKTVRFRVIEDPNTALLALKKGEIEDMEFEPEQWVDQTNDADFYRLNTKARGVQWVYYYFGWNCGTPYFDDVRVRQAMSYCVDYDHILNTLCYGLYPRCTGELHPDSWAGPDKPRTPYTQDLPKAEALLEAAGWTDSDGDGVRDKTISGRKVDFKFNVMCFNQQIRVDVCTSLKESLDRIGIVCNVQPTEFTVMQQKARDHEFQAMFAAWGTGTDPFTTENLWKTGEGRNYGMYSNPQVDELFAKAKVALEREDRAKYYREIDEILWDEQPYTWMYYKSAFYGFNKNLRGYMFSPRGPYNYGPGFDSIWAATE